MRDGETFHNNFQGLKIPEAGGYRGRQLRVIVKARYINRLLRPSRRQNSDPVGNVGVVIFYTGPSRRRVSDPIVTANGQNGSRGVWRDPLLPGKCAFNTYAGKIEIIPTVNFIPNGCAAKSRVNSTRICRDFADHEGCVRADTAALGGDAHRLQEGADDHPAFRRRETGRQTRPDSQRFFRTSRKDDADQLLQNRAAIRKDQPPR